MSRAALETAANQLSDAELALRVARAQARRIRSGQRLVREPSLRASRYHARVLRETEALLQEAQERLLGG